MTLFRDLLVVIMNWFAATNFHDWDYHKHTRNIKGLPVCDFCDNEILTNLTEIKFSREEKLVYSVARPSWPIQNQEFMARTHLHLFYMGILPYWFETLHTWYFWKEFIPQYIFMQKSWIPNVTLLCPKGSFLIKLESS